MIECLPTCVLEIRHNTYVGRQVFERLHHLKGGRHGQNAAKSGTRRRRDTPRRRTVHHPLEQLPPFDAALYVTKIDDIIPMPRRARRSSVPHRQFDGLQVGDPLNLWSKDDLKEEFYSARRALCIRRDGQAHARLGERGRLVGFDEYDGGVHDMQGTRSLKIDDLSLLLSFQSHPRLVGDRHAAKALYVHDAGLHVTGFTHDTHQFFAVIRCAPAISSSFSPRSICSAPSPPVLAAIAAPSQKAQKDRNL